MGRRETFTPFDAAEYLKTDEDMALYLDAIMEESNGDPRMIAVALGDIARAKGMTQIAKATGLARENLYKALSADGNPEFSTVMKVITALGLKLHASSATTAKLRNAPRKRPARELAKVREMEAREMAQRLAAAEPAEPIMVAKASRKRSTLSA